jgi:acyl-CoA thioester hydrolase
MQQNSRFSYYHPIQIRYGDLDMQRHVNNAVYLTYLESARLGYYEQVGIWKRENGLLTGMVVARIEIDYLAPILFGQDIQVGLRMDNIGQKSLNFAYQIESVDQDQAYARGKTVMVAYDDAMQQSIQVPDSWREKIAHFEKGESTHGPANI